MLVQKLQVSLLWWNVSHVVCRNGGLTVKFILSYNWIITTNVVIKKFIFSYKHGQSEKKKKTYFEPQKLCVW